MSFEEHYMDTTVDEIMDLSRKHATAVKNDTEETAADSMVRALNENANEVLKEIMNLILAATKMTNANEYTVLKNAQGNSSQTVVAKNSADKPFKHRKLECPAFDENNRRSDLNNQLPCQTLTTPKIGNLDSSKF
ncbi:hypothetical protein H5410_002013 [Solanum commersonii]|uniref:Uncharacterized protein n=1 Tax=Solanum commersonii TaxID=4109 RepID=A0A9J6B0Q8_SOLCO|nr:hypothetical protein H5410_002013 [Solanum commersonii]